MLLNSRGAAPQPEETLPENVGSMSNNATAHTRNILGVRREPQKCGNDATYMLNIEDRRRRQKTLRQCRQLRQVSWGVTMRFYTPKTPAFYGRWAPALVKLTEGKIQAIPQ